MKLRAAIASTALALLIAVPSVAQESPSPTGASGSSLDDIGDVTIEMWQHTYPPLQAWTEARLAEFMAEHPNVTVELQAIPFQQYLDVLFTALASGEAPPFFEVNEWTMTQFVDAGHPRPARPRGPRLRRRSTRYARAYEGTSLEGAIFDEVLYGSPYDWSAPVLGVNNALLEAAGIDKASLTTWEAALDQLSAVSETDENGNLVTSGLSFVHGIDNYYKHQGNSLFAQAGARIINEDGHRGGHQHAGGPPRLPVLARRHPRAARSRSRASPRPSTRTSWARVAWLPGSC